MLLRLRCRRSIIRFQSLSISNVGCPKFKVVFCGKGHFMSSYLYTSEYLSNHSFIDVSQCPNDNLEEHLRHADVVIPFMGKLSDKVLRSCERLKLIMQYGAGLEGVDIASATAHGVKVARIPSWLCDNASSCAEHILYLCLALLRNQQEMSTSLRHRVVGVPTGRTINGSKVLIYGYGGIGKQVYKKMTSLGAEVYVISRGDAEGIAEESRVGTHGQRFSQFAADVDVLVLCCSQNPGNVGMVNRCFLEQFRDGLLVINVARGGLLHYPDVWSALDNGKIGGLGIDVYHTEPFPPDDCFLQHPRVVATPHVAGVTVNSYKQMSEILSENVLRVVRGESPLHVVN